MQISVESVGALGRRMTVAVPAARVEQEVNQRLEQISKNARLPGFRPGKAPRRLLEARYGSKIFKEAADDLIHTSFHEAIGQQGLRPAGGPQIEPRTVDRGQDLEYVAIFEVFPEVQRLDIAGVKIEQPAVEVQDEDVERTLQTMRRQHETWKPAGRAAQVGDRLTVDFRGTLKGQTFDGGEAKGLTVVLGSGLLVPGFEDQLVGAMAGQALELEIPFPADYAGKELAGQTVRFDVQVDKVEAAELPELDDTFARTFGAEDGGLAKLRVDVVENLRREVADRVRRQVRDRVLDAVLEVNELEVPQQLVDVEVARLIQLARANFQGRGASADQAPADGKLYEGQARRRVALGLIVAEIARAEKLQPDEDRVRATVERLAVNYDKPQEFVDWHFADPKRLVDVKNLVVEEMLVERLLEKANIVEVPMSFDELMYPAGSGEHA